MRHFRLLAMFAVLLLIQACKHPLEIVGRGDIVDLNESGHGCTLEQFQSQDPACTENEVSGEYNVTYQPIPRPGWQFVRWEGPCDRTSRKPLCQFDVASDWIDWFNANYSEEEIPATVEIGRASCRERV